MTLSYMRVVAILFMYPGRFVLSASGDSTRNLVTIGQVAFDEMF